jgi:hypothetical protein
VGILLCFCAGVMVAQINPIYQSIQKNRKSLAEHPVPQLGRFDKVDYIRLMGYDSTAIANLENIGVNFSELWRNMNLNEQEKAVRADCIIIGTVAKVDHFRNPRGKFIDFATTAYVEVEEFLRNDFNLPKRHIPIKIETGPGVGVSGEDTLGLGEHVLLFLGAAYLMEYAERYLPEYYERSINDSTIQFQIIGFRSKYIIKSDRASNRFNERNRDLGEVKEEIRAVVDAISKNR